MSGAPMNRLQPVCRFYTLRALYLGFVLRYCLFPFQLGKGRRRITCIIVVKQLPCILFRLARTHHGVGYGFAVLDKRADVGRQGI